MHPPTGCCEGRLLCCGTKACTPQGERRSRCAFLLLPRCAVAGCAALTVHRSLHRQPRTNSRDGAHRWPWGGSKRARACVHLQWENEAAKQNQSKGGTKQANHNPKSTTAQKLATATASKPKEIPRRRRAGGALPMGRPFGPRFGNERRPERGLGVDGCPWVDYEGAWQVCAVLGGSNAEEDRSVLGWSL